MAGLFFQRQKKLRGEYPTTFQYDKMPQTLMTQIWLVWREYDDVARASSDLVKLLRQEIGTFRLSDVEYHQDTLDCQFKELAGLFFNDSGIDMKLTVLELIFLILNNHFKDDKVKLINRYMRESGFGYTFNLEENQLIRIEDETFYEEITVPTLSILGQRKYQEAGKSYHSAYDELKKGKLDKAIVDCSKALESILKVRLKENGISYENPKGNKELTLAPLLNTMKDYIVVPPYMTSSLSNLKEVMMAVGTVRNNDGAHGSMDGIDPAIDERFVRYMINQTAANILFIAEADFDPKKKQETQ